MYGPGGGGGGGPRPPRGPAGNQKPALSDLPPNLKMMFEPRNFIPFKMPPAERTLPPYTGIAQYVNLFEKTPPPPVEPFVPPEEVKKQMKEKMAATNKEKNAILAADWDPHKNSKATENAYLTLFVGRLSYDTTEKKLRREFEQFGPIRTIKMVQDLEGKPRGYAFVEFENEKDMTEAVKRWDGRKIDGRRVVLDVERGRTVRNWLPTRFGGGLGGRKEMKSKKQLQEEAQKNKAEADKLRASQVYGPGGDRGGGRDSGRGGRDGGDFRRNDRSRSRDRGPPPAPRRESNGGSGRDYDNRDRRDSRDSRDNRDGRGGYAGDSRGGGGRDSYGGSSSSSFRDDRGSGGGYSDSRDYGGGGGYRDGRGGGDSRGSGGGYGGPSSSSSAGGYDNRGGGGAPQRGRGGLGSRRSRSRERR